MCFTAAKDKDLDKINFGRKKHKFKIRDQYLFKPSYKLLAFKHDYIPVFRNPETLEFFSWTLIQPVKSDFGKNREWKEMTANAKAETIFEKSLYKRAIYENRCVIVIDGFFEWRHLFKPVVRYPHYIYHRNLPVLYIGGIWNEWQNLESGEIKNTVSMITTRANPMMEIIHNQKKSMPFIMDPETALIWLKKDLSHDDLVRLMITYPEEKMAYHTVARNWSPKSPEAIKTFVYPELTSEQLSML